MPALRIERRTYRLQGGCSGLLSYAGGSERTLTHDESQGPTPAVAGVCGVTLKGRLNNLSPSKATSEVVYLFIQKSDEDGGQGGTRTLTILFGEF